MNAACDNRGISVVEAAFRWMTKNSALDATAGDGVLIGASSNEQLKQNIKFLEKTILIRTFSMLLIYLGVFRKLSRRLTSEQLEKG